MAGPAGSVDRNRERSGVVCSCIGGCVVAPVSPSRIVGQEAWTCGGMRGFVGFPRQGTSCFTDNRGSIASKGRIYCGFTALGLEAFFLFPLCFGGTGREAQIEGPDSNKNKARDANGTRTANTVR